MNLRHRKMLLAMGARAAAAIQAHPLDSGMDGIRAAEAVIKLERLLLDKPGESTALTVEQVTRDEMSRLLTEKEDDWDDDAEDLEA
jgi:hypothetical protein